MHLLSNWETAETELHAAHQEVIDNTEQPVSNEAYAFDFILTIERALVPA
jgi:hypothetical protein